MADPSILARAAIKRGEARDRHRPGRRIEGCPRFLSRSEMAMTTTPRRALLTLVSTFAYLGLAILGAGGIHRFFAHPPVTVATIVLFMLSGAALFSEGNVSPGEREDRNNRWVIAALGVLGTLAAFVPAYTDHKEIWTLDGDLVRWLGVVLFAAGGALRLWPVFILGRRFSGLVAIQPGHRLVTDGVYGTIRHPSYLGLLNGFVGLGARVSLGRLRAAYRTHDLADSRTHPCRGAALAFAFRRGIRSLCNTHGAAHPRRVLNLRERDALDGAAACRLSCEN